MKRVDPTENPYLRILFYGVPGSTKTRTSLSAALDDRTFPCLVLEAGGNPLSIRDYERKPDIIRMEDLADYNIPFDWLYRGQPENDPFCIENELRPPYKCLVIDSITEVQRLSFEAQKGRVLPGSFPEKNTRQHFYNTLGQMVNFAKLFYSLPMHVVMTALESRDKNEATGTINYSPLLWGQSSTEVGGYAYVVSRLVHRASMNRVQLEVLEDPSQLKEGEEVNSVALFLPSGTYIAKDQYGVLGDWMVNPTMTKILDAIEKAN